jgi:hypothetical protein
MGGTRHFAIVDPDVDLKYAQIPVGAALAIAYLT